MEKTVITEAITLLYAWAYWMSDIAHLILTVSLCGANVFIGKQKRYREVKLFFQGHTANKWWTLDSDLGGPDTKYLLITSLH